MSLDCPSCRNELNELPAGSGYFVCEICGKTFRKRRKASAKKTVSKLRFEPKVKYRPWEYFLAFFGVPVHGMRDNLRRTFPWVCVITTTIVVIISLNAFRYLDVLVPEWGFIPNDPLRKAGITYLTAFFLHADFGHLLTNMYFLLVFGDLLEEEIGHLKFFILLVLATVVGNVVHGLLDSSSDIPLIGASGGVSGVILYFAMQFPKSKFGILVLFQWVQIPATLYVAFWILFQLVGAIDQVAGVSNVSSLAHLAGAVMGYLLWRRWRHAKT